MAETNLSTPRPNVEGADSSKFEPCVGSYAMHRVHDRASEALVRVSSKSEGGNFFVEYVPNGGGSGSWSADGFAPVTDPVLIAVCNAHDATLRAKDHEVKAKRAHDEARTWRRVADVLKECPPGEITLPEATR